VRALGGAPILLCEEAMRERLMIPVTFHQAGARMANTQHEEVN